MAIELKMPALSPTMERGTLAKWLIAEGDAVKPGDYIAEIETDKATMELEAVDEGYVSRIAVPAGTENVSVGTVIAILGEPRGQKADARPADTPPVTPLATQDRVGAEAVAPVAVAPPEPAADAPAAHRPIAPADGLRISPLAHRIALAEGVDLGRITGSGPHGRIVRADLGLPAAPRAHAALPVVQAAETSAPAAIAPPPADVPVETRKLTAIRKTIARRLSESKQTIPHFYLTVRCNLDPLLALRAELNAALDGGGVRISVNDMLIKAMAMALMEVPEANVQFGGDELHQFGRADIAMAVAIDGGLITPVIRNANGLSLSAIAETAKALADKARAGRLVPEDYQGGTASLSNLGMFGIDEMFPVINPPQALILGTAAGIRQPWDVNGRMELATVMAATASFDHRAIDGATAARFMAALRRLVETPLLILS